MLPGRHSPPHAERQGDIPMADKFEDIRFDDHDLIDDEALDRSKAVTVGSIMTVK
jgi:hypothetical protein